MLFFFLLIAVTAVVAAIAFMVIIFSFTIWADLKGAPFVRSRKDRIETMLGMADIRPGVRVLELGSGDGTLVLQAAQMGAIATGIEINPFLVWLGRRNTRKAALDGRADFIRADIFKISLTEEKPDIVLLYLLPGTLKKLKEKLAAELPAGTRIISNAFRIEGLMQTAAENNVYAYVL